LPLPIKISGSVPNCRSDIEERSYIFQVEPHTEFGGVIHAAFEACGFCVLPRKQDFHHYRWICINIISTIHISTFTQRFHTFIIKKDEIGSNGLFNFRSVPYNHV